LPETYEKWAADLQSRKDRDRHAYQAAPRGQFRSHDVRVNGGKFKQYCDERKERPTLRMLDQFVNDSSRDHG
jgi:hypothetical protein